MTFYRTKTLFKILPDIEDYSNRALMDMYEAEIKRMHYDPCDSMAEQPFDLSQLCQEILRRMGN